MNVHAVLGRGVATSKAVKEAFFDAVNEKDTVALVWSVPPTEAQEVIWDIVLDDEIPFIMFYAEGDKVHPDFRNAEFGVVQKVRNPEVAALKAVEGRGKVLFLWDDEAEDDQVDYVFDTVEPGTLVLNLANGLAPITIDVDIPEPKDPEVEDEGDDIPDDMTFTKEELEIMAAAAVKRYGAKLGCEGKTKSAIIAELFPEDEDDEPVSKSTDVPADADDDEVILGLIKASDLLRQIADLLRSRSQS